MSKFMTKPSDKWTCDVCMISNTADKFKCAACETPKPGGGGEEAAAVAEPKATFNFGDGGGFKFVSSDNATKRLPLFQGPTGSEFSPTEEVQNSDGLESLNIYHLIT
jgi:hypothetical protein